MSCGLTEKHKHIIWSLYAFSLINGTEVMGLHPRPASAQGVLENIDLSPCFGAFLGPVKFRDGTPLRALEMSSNYSQVSEEKEGAWPGKAQVLFLVVDSALLLVTLVLGSAANVFVVHAVRRHRTLRTAANALLVNLALVDLLRCAADCPFLLLQLALRARPTAQARADLGLALCGAQLASFSLNCGAQLLTVAGISVERHRAVTKPFEGDGKERKRRVIAWIPVTWAAPALASALCARFARDSPVYARCRGLRATELSARDSFGRYVLLPAWCACLTLIAACYTHIFLVVRAHSRKVFDKGAFPPPGMKAEERTARKENAPEVLLVPELKVAAETVIPNEEKHLNALAGKEHPNPQTLTNDCVTSAPELREGDGASPTEIKSWEGSAHQDVPHENPPERTGTEGNDASPADIHEKAQRDALQDAHENTSEHIGIDGNDAPRADDNENAHQCAQALEAAPQRAVESAPQGEEVMGAVCMMPSFANRDKGNKKKESKLAKRSGYIIFTFLVFWLPLMGTIVFNVILGRSETPAGNVVQELEVLAVCIACMTSLTNPIIYAAVNPQFRNEFYYLKNKWKMFFIRSRRP
ncbi:D(2) dopamine receptor-like [Hoplias malabaricus]|uniref:D(2) dopamine receptor-like n=1 Tax=Hoplias malabaricus TaxID=27720 RepID=UPI00346200B8